MSRRVRVNPIACDGSRLCAELLPERIRLDEWGYPIVDPEPLTAELEKHARRAVDACPTMALLLEKSRSADGPAAEDEREDGALARRRARHEHPHA